jgi:biopolymer transport protein ExbB
MKSLRLILGMIVLIAAELLLTYPAAAQSPQAGATGQSATKQTAGAEYAAHVQTYLGWFVRSSGVIGLFILVLAVYMVATVVRLHGSLRPDVAAPPDQFANIQTLIGEGDHKGVISYVRSNDSYLCRVLTLGLVELPNGLAHARDYMERHGEAEAVEMENQISMLAVLGTLGPMIGLIGTLKGMIASFSVIATSEMQLRTSAVAGGISEALLLTFEGVALSVPAIYFFAVFRNRVSSISVGTMLRADTLLLQFANTVRIRSTAAPQAAPRAAAA